MWAKTVKVVGVEQRKFVRNGQEMTFNDLHFIDGHKVGKLNIPDGLAVSVAGMAGQDVTLGMEIEASNPTWLYRVNVISAEPVKGIRAASGQ